MLREFRYVLGSAYAGLLRDTVLWVDHPRWRLKLFRNAATYIAIVDGARPASRRMCAGLQYLKADQSG